MIPRKLGADARLQDGRGSRAAMRVLLTALMMLAAGTAVAAEAGHEEACAAITPRIENQVRTAVPEVVIDEASQTTDDLAVMSGFRNDSRNTVGGVTAATPLIEYEVVSNLAIPANRQGVCARPAIKLTLGYKNLNVYMDWEIPRGSCIYNAIFAHEMHHVAIYKDYLNRRIGQVRQSADAKFDGRTYFFRSLYEAKQYVEILGEVFARHVSDQFFSEINAEQAALDNQAEYSRMQMECK